MSPDPGDEAPALPGLGGTPMGPANETGAQPGADLDGLDAAALQVELARAEAMAADSEADYGAAVLRRAEAMAAGDLGAIAALDEVADARAVLARTARARASAVRDALWAVGVTVQTKAGEEVDKGRTDCFVDVEDFVAHYLSPIIQRKMGGGVVWCQRWWAHPEAANRLWTLWRGYEAARMQEKGSLSRWWVNQVDPHLAVLFNDRGPFSECRKGKHKVSPGLSHEPAPEGWWTVLSGDFDTPVTSESTSESDGDGDGDGEIERSGS